MYIFAKIKFLKFLIPAKIENSLIWKIFICKTHHTFTFAWLYYEYDEPQ